MALFLTDKNPGEENLITPGEPLSSKDQPAIIKEIGITTDSLNEVDGSMLDRTKASGLFPELISGKVVFNYQLPSETISGRSYRVFRRISISGTEKSIWKNLLWKALFQGLDVDEFLFLDYLTRRKWVGLNTTSKRAVVEVIRGCCDRQPSSKSFGSKLPAARIWIKHSTPSILGSQGYQERITDILHELGLPSKGTIIEKNVTEIKREIPGVTPERFIGVGYKDKGTLSSTEREHYSTSDYTNDPPSFESEFRKILSLL